MPEEPTQQPPIQPTEPAPPEQPAPPAETPPLTKTPPQTEPQPTILQPPTEEQKPEVKEIPVVTQQDLDKQIEERLRQERNERRKLANEARTKKKSYNLDKLLQFAKQKKVITNADARDFLHVSQSTASNYLTELAKRGLIKREGQRGAAKYSA